MRLQLNEIEQGQEVWLTLVHYTNGLNKPQKVLAPTLCKYIGGKFYSNNKHITHRTTDFVYCNIFDNEEEAYQCFFDEVNTNKNLIQHAIEQATKHTTQELAKLEVHIDYIKKHYPEHIV